ncbi:unnamed protein product [Rodentolepis nana]|uniref:Reverse transcriptase domain-containing protein n=1 Tax=Rodentolepis nana TaxID=102285 RepID=A0A0R3TUH5_RODNA|nr:unnamed protein product [Rodentolepis nana]
MLNSNPLELIYSNEDFATYLHYNGTRTTPGSLLASSDINEHASDISEHTHRKIIDDPGFLVTNQERTSRMSPRLQQHPDKLCTAITNIMIRCAKKIIPRGKTKYYRVFWSEHFEEMKRKRDALHNTAKQTGRMEEVKAWRRQSAVLRQVILQAKRASFNEFISNINYQSDGQYTFKFLGNLQNKPIRPSTPNNVLTEPFRPCKLNAAIKQLKCKKSPGVCDKTAKVQEVSWRRAQVQEVSWRRRMGPKAKESMLTLFNKIWETSLVTPQWRVALVIPILKKGKDLSNFDNYRLILLTSMLAKPMERMVNRRLTWFLEANNILRNENAGSRPQRSTNQQVVTFSQNIKDALDARNTPTAVYVDFKSAYDLVWKEKLIQKLAKIGIKYNMLN